MLGTIALGEIVKAVDLFCGTGGFSLGAHRAGFDVVCAYDKDEVLTSSFERNFPNTKLKIRDIGTLAADEIRKHAGGDIDLIFGGPPCQGFSSIGKRDKEDKRRRLLDHFFRLVAELRPRAFVMENVKGLGFKDAKPELDAALDELPDCYEISEPLILDASKFGAATKRPRLFVIGYDPARCGAIDFDALTKRDDGAAKVSDALGDLVGYTCVDEDGDVWKLPELDVVSEYAANLRSPDLTFTGNQRTKHTAKVVERFSNVKQGETDKVGRHPRLKLDGQCPTLRAGTGSDMGSYQSVRPIHPTENRVITAREAARLQGFPDNHFFHETIWHSFRMIGNSVSPIAAERVLRHVHEALKETQIKKENGSAVA